MAEKRYKIKEAYYTIQGEGFHTGRPAVFVRFSGCNLWSGLEKDRETAICRFCDTDFWGMDGENGGSYSASELSGLILSLWPSKRNAFVVLTGGEPLLQLDDSLVQSLTINNIYIAIETNGTIKVPEGIDWICVSPKANTEILQTKGNEIKIIHPQDGIDPKDFEDFDFDHFYLQAMDNPFLDENLRLSTRYCMENPQWQMSIQTHKLLNIK